MSPILADGLRLVGKAWPDERVAGNRLSRQQKYCSATNCSPWKILLRRQCGSVKRSWRSAHIKWLTARGRLPYRGGATGWDNFMRILGRTMSINVRKALWTAP
jgi:hypothetical protein